MAMNGIVTMILMGRNGYKTVEHLLEMEVLMGKSSINEGFSIFPCHI
jgi:hypothetical protein